MEEGAWVKELKAAITVCDRDGVVLEMNDRAAVTFAADGGRALLGQDPARLPPREGARAARGHARAGQDTSTRSRRTA